ncbi:MAG: hypothetical protein KC636_03905, partial [Myxococcales bacterium]|nr:hypothetical protein [Myxococcales bacterium]
TEATQATDDATQGTSETDTTEVEPQDWEPGVSLATPREPGPRGYLDRRGLIHAHSVYSHDACDGEPKDADGDPDLVCMEDFRRGICRSRHDFVMLTDHRESFSDTEFPEALLYEPGRGDALVDRGGGPVASWLACDDIELAGNAPRIAPLVMAGNEAAFMPVGLEGHVADTPSARSDIYGRDDDEAIAAVKAHGGLALMAHTENWTAEQLATMPLDGFEMYNIHANLFLNLGAALALVAKAEMKDPGLPHPDLSLLPIYTEDPAYVDTWAAVLAQGARRVTTMGTDCHRNTFTQELADGERIDSYERMMKWFSNHLLVAPSGDDLWDDKPLKEALAAGRLYGVFELMGYAEGFDFHARVDDEVYEMGAAVAAPARLVVHAPSVQQLADDAAPPELVVRVLRAEADGWVEVASELGDEGHTLELDITDPGAYRAEIRIIPHHLAPYLGDEVALADEEHVWIYANPIYVTG